jgi:hypothetical protein
LSRCGASLYSARTRLRTPTRGARALYREIHKNPPTALCLSGGGIRSGTFALGVLQGLAQLGVLGKFDYLSTVSGGGYIGGWLSALLHRRGPAQRDQTLRSLDPAQAQLVTGNNDAPAVDYVRRTCQYLAPSGSTASADFWTVLATLIRNLTLNWMVILPLLAAALLLPRLFYTLTHAFETDPTLDTGFQCLAKIAGVVDLSGDCGRRILYCRRVRGTRVQRRRTQLDARTVSVLVPWACSDRRD